MPIYGPNHDITLSLFCHLTLLAYHQQIVISMCTNGAQSQVGHIFVTSFIPPRRTLYILCSYKCLCLILSRTRKQQKSEESKQHGTASSPFRFEAARIWNSLQIDSYPHFKRLIRTWESLGCKCHLCYIHRIPLLYFIYLFVLC